MPTERQLHGLATFHVGVRLVIANVAVVACLFCACLSVWSHTDNNPWAVLFFASLLAAIYGFASTMPLLSKWDDKPWT